MQIYRMVFFRITLLVSLILTQCLSLFAQNTLDLIGLDNTSPATVAYSMRKLSSSYSGFAIQIRRSNDNATQNIGFAGNGDLDIAALTSFVGANNAFVTTWYDQSGNANNLTQATASRQPWIVHSGVVDKENSRPFIRFYGHNGIDFDTDLLQLGAEMTTTGHLITVNKFASVAAGGAGFILGHTSSIYDWHSQYPIGRMFHTSITSSSILNGLAWQNGISISPSLAVFNASLMVNSIAPQSPSTNTRWNNIGSDRNGFHDVNLGGGYAELITFSTALGSAARISVEKNQGIYYAVPIAGNYLNRNGAYTSGTSDLVNRFGGAEGAGMMLSGQMISRNVPSAPVTNEVTSITASGADLSATLSATDGANTTVGFCWGTSTSPTTSGSNTAAIHGSSTFTTTITGLTIGTKYFVRSYARNNVGTTYGNEVSFIYLGVGFAYQGGKVAYIYQPADPGYVAGETHGLIASDSNQGTTSYGCSGTDISGVEGSALGTGSANTTNILVSCSVSGIAAKIAADYSVVDGGNTYSDWFLPSIDELSRLYVSRSAVGGYLSARYWSSTESTSEPTFSAQIIFFGTGVVTEKYSKSNTTPYVRPVHYF